MTVIDVVLGDLTMMHMADQAVRQYAILDSPGEPVFDDLVDLLATRMGVGHAELAIVTSERVWLKAAMRSTRGISRPPESSLCASVAADRHTLVVTDGLRSDRFREHPAVRAGMRFYAGVPLITADGAVLGALCAWDEEPHSLSDDDVLALEQFGRHAVALIEFRKMATLLDRERAILAATGTLLELIVGGAKLPHVLDTLARAVEAAMPPTRCAIQLLTGSVLRDGAGPSLSATYRQTIDGTRIGPAVGSCGTAAFTGQTVIASDIATDARWAGYRDLASAAGLRACWSVPITGPLRHVLGTFTLYYDEVRVPSGDELGQLSRWVNLAEVAITRARDISALREAAILDPLTGLANRTEVISRLRSAIAAGQSVAVLFVDLDQFKFVNDTFGHGAGDEFLRTVAQRLTDCVGPDDTVARLGGDEFLVLCLGVTDVAGAEALARRIVTAVQRPMTMHGRTLSLSASVGVAINPAEQFAGSSDLIEDADLAMYAAKKAGRNSIAVFGPQLRQRAASRLSLEGDLGLALENGELDCAYQPLVDLATGRLLAVEALLRWQSPVRGQVPPLAIIPLAEESGLISDVGEFMLRRSCAQLAGWRAADELWAGVTLWLNVSTRQMCDPAFVDLVHEVLDLHRLPASALGLEVTESALIEDTPAALAGLLKLRAGGIRVAIDDFGVGYSSIARLKNLPVDALKIAREFVTDLGSDSTNAGIVRAIVTLARTIGLELVAEGVETQRQRRRLLDLGCPTGQGFLWSPPIARGKLTELVARAPRDGQGAVILGVEPS